MKTEIQFYDSSAEQTVKIKVSDSGFTGKDLLLVSAEQYVREIKGTGNASTETSLGRDANLTLASVMPLNSSTKPIQRSRTETGTSSSTYTYIAGGSSGQSY